MQASILRTPGLEPLSNEQLRRYSPAIFAKEPHGDVSKRYGFIPTYKILESMHQHGFVPVEVRNYARKAAEDMQFTKHLIRFRQTGKLSARTVGDVVPQIVFLNSHDRSSHYQLYGGLFRLVCSNGLLVSTSETVQPVIVRHTINVVEQIVAVSEKIIQHHREVFRYINDMRKVQLTAKQQHHFASKALALRPDRPGSIEPAALLVPRRPEDNKPDLWTVFNRVQENLTKGGVEGRTANGRRIVTSEIKGINADVALNAGAWELAMQFITRAQASSKRSTKREPVTIDQ